MSQALLLAMLERVHVSPVRWAHLALPTWLPPLLL